MSEAAATSPVLSVRDLRTSVSTRAGEERQLVKGVSFDIGPRETLALVGESGSGKSVTALSIMRLFGGPQARITGSVVLDGRDLLALGEAEMREIRGKDVSMIFQEPMTSLNPLLTIGYQIAEVLIRHRGVTSREARAETVRLLQKVRIPEAADRFDDYPHRLSGGMRQRVMIAMALACKPKLLIADEPTTALDVTIQAQTLTLMKMLQDEEGMSVLFITHDMGVVAEIADRTIVMHSGEAVETGDTAQVFAHPRHDYTRMLLAAVPQLGSMNGVQGPQRFPEYDPASRSYLPPRAGAVPERSTHPLLQVRDLVARFPVRRGPLGRTRGIVHAVEKVSFDIMPGETLALVGESGCGKSTTGRSILRLTEPTSGSIRLDGKDVLEMTPREQRAMRRDMQMIFQDPFASLDPRMKVGSAIAEPLLTHRLCDRRSVRERVAGLLERVGLGADMADRYPHEFSGGQRQRICIARALALNPRLIVADEAVSALDVSIKAQVVNLMLDLQESLGLAYLFISHDMAVVERISHRVAVMYLGEIVEIGPREAVFGDPRHPYTRKLLSAVPIPDPARRGPPRPLSDDEIRSPVHLRSYTPPPRAYREVGTGHLVQI